MNWLGNRHVLSSSRSILGASMNFFVEENYRLNPSNVYETWLTLFEKSGIARRLARHTGPVNKWHKWGNVCKSRRGSWLIECLKSFVTSSQKQAGIEGMLLPGVANRSRSWYPQNNPRYYRKLIEYFSEALPKTNRHITLFEIAQC